ncbi:MAG: error-prone DNA polymerase [Tepidisphaeraceae bacterium]
MPESPQEKIRPVPEPPAETFAPSDVPYAELDVTTNFSFLHGASHPDELVLQAARLGHRAIAVTDINSLAGAVRMFDAHQQITKVGWAPKLVIGARLQFTDGPDVIVWAPDRPAYARLCRLLTLGRRSAEKGQCSLSVYELINNPGGLLAGVVPSKPFMHTTRIMPDLRDALGPEHLSIVVSRVYGGDDESRVRNAISLGRQFGVPLLATNGVHYHDPSRRPLQDVLTCVRHGCTVHDAGFKLFPNGERYLKSPEQMHRLFADLPQAIQRGLEIADRCTFRMNELQYEYPHEVVPPGKSMTEHLRALTYAGATGRYPAGIPGAVRELIEKELAFIQGSKYEPYFLTVHDLVHFARSQKILCQGRGSAANSAVCYCLGITSVDPARFQLVFERFTSAARTEPPDIDIDFEHERREEVIQYVYEKYGRERAGMTAVVITYRGRSAVRDVGKAMGLGLDLIEQLAGKLDWWHRGTLDDAQLREAGIDPTDHTVKLLIHLTAELLGFPRHLSQHVGGLVISQTPLCEIVPIENAAMKDRTVIEWDKDDINLLNLFKVDVLALGMLTAISKGLKLSETGRELHTIPPDDPVVYDMLCDADTIGVFQVESRAQMSMLPRLQPRKFYDIVIEVAIVRPGPIQGNMVHPYLKERERQRNDPKYRINYPKEELRGVLEQTLGIPLFQEQAMRLAIVAARFTAEEADQLRRAMAAWKRHGGIEMFHDKFVSGMTKRDYDPDFAERCFQQISGFGEYGFPESHAASFAILVYASAWLKRHHPAAFAAALLNSQPMGFYAPAQIVRDARDHGVEVRPVDVNESEWDCTLEAPLTPSPTYSGERAGERGERRNAPSSGRLDDAYGSANRAVLDASRRTSPISPKITWGIGGPALRLGFRQISGMRQDHAERLVAARRRHGRFASIEAFHRVTELPVATVRRLAEADAFGSVGDSRRPAVWNTLPLRDADAPLFQFHDEGGKMKDENRDGSYFSSFRLHPSSFDLLPPMPLGQEVMTDYATLRLSLKKHPVAIVRPSLDERKILTARQINQTPNGKWVKVAGLVLIRQRPGTASGIVFETLEDETGIVNLIVRPDIYERYRPAARHAALLQCDGYLERQGQVVHIMAKRLFDLGGLLHGYRLESRDFH